MSALFEIPYTNQMKEVSRIAQAIAVENLNAQISSAHFLKAVLHKSTGLHPILKKLGKDIFYLEEWADVRIDALPKSISMPMEFPADESLQRVIEEADSIRVKLSADLIDSIHILAALSTPGVGFTYDQLKTFPLRRDEILHQLGNVPGSTQPIQQNGTPHDSLSKSALSKFCMDRSAMAEKSLGEKIVGRDKEIRMMSEILCRRSKPNVLITGEPGVGKSAMVDAYANAILHKQVPTILYNARIFELNTGALVAGASYKGEIEDRLKKILSEIKQVEKAILFIDEIHFLLDKQGAAAGAANLLKPELARGEITVIGATTIDEYRKFIQRDEAFNRRFELLNVEEPDAGLCFQMMRAILPQYEQHHAITISDETIRYSIAMAKRYLKERRLPDAAIDLADRSMAALRLINDTGEKDLAAFQAEIESLERQMLPADEALEAWHWLHQQTKDKLSPILWAAVQSEEDPALMGDADLLKEYLKDAARKLKSSITTTHTELANADIAAIVSYKTGIPIGKVQTQERERLLNMETILKQRVVGQDHAIKTISEAILESRSGLNKAGQPLGSFFFLGPTGTGKTELAKALADFLFQDESFMIRFDMSEFKEEHAAALLYGAPPGYVGYEEGGMLVNKIRQKPYSVVLFDEIEKAHASVFDLFLQIMDEGKLHDKLGKEGDFSNALIIFTSNIGSQFIEEHLSKGINPASAQLMEVMSQYFRPEFLGRLTEIVPFASIPKKVIRQIFNIQLKGLFALLEKKQIHLQISDGASDYLTELGYNPRYGARPMSGVIRNYLRRPLSKMLISGELQEGKTASLHLRKDAELIWELH